MKRYAVLTEGQLVFNETENWFDKNKDKFVEQKEDEGATVRAFEKRYGISFVWKKDVGYIATQEVA